MSLAWLKTPVNRIEVSTLSSTKTCSSESIERIRSWDKTCSSFHSECKKSRISNKLPLRLLDVIPSDADEARVAEVIHLQQYDELSLDSIPGTKILSTKSIPPESSYLTLSHRWGTPPGITLSRNTSFLLGEDISRHLVETGDAAVFRHAIQVTRSLGYRYLWIDALCIMQDDEIERTNEIMRMDDIYFNSALNISATEGSTDGLLLDRNLYRINPCRVTVKGTSDHPDVSLEAVSERCFLGSSDGPLNQRGWVFQERYLAPRVVHFTKDQIFWECHELVASETLPFGISDAVSAKRAPFQNASALPSDQLNQTKDQWYELVYEYSRTSLTYGDDRLLAISAIAKRYCSHMGLDSTDYLAGVWKTDLPVSLLWYQTSGKSAPIFDSEGESTIAPSWSWASILTRIEYFNQVIGDELVVHTEVMQTTIHRRSPNYFDGAISCRLRLRGPLCKVHRYIIDGQPELRILNDQKNTEAILRESYYGLSIPDGTGDIFVTWDTSRKAVVQYLNDKNVHDSTPSEFVLLRIASQANGEAIHVRGIVLQRTDLNGTFRRVGYFYIQYEGGDRTSGIEDAFNGVLQTLDADDYLEIDSEGQHTIDLI
ncbi:HET-domain-containing protein [Cadophora sp. DSE1049]|nr:HET-domain-containing protein [Cadophora sp. DSE1049]